MVLGACKVLGGCTALDGCVVQDGCMVVVVAQLWMGARCCWVHGVGGCTVQDVCTVLGGCTALLGAWSRMGAQRRMGARCCWVHGAGRCTSAAPSPRPDAKFQRPHRKPSRLSELCGGPGRPERCKRRAGGEKAGQLRAASVTLARSSRPSRKQGEGSAGTSPGAQRAAGHGVRARGTAGPEQTLWWRPWGSRG